MAVGVMNRRVQYVDAVADNNRMEVEWDCLLCLASCREIIERNERAQVHAHMQRTCTD